VIIWQELAKYNSLLNHWPARLWYNLIARTVFKKIPVVARSKAAKDFISRFCKNVCPMIIDHGVNLNVFTTSSKARHYFVVNSQLICRKRIDRTLDAFTEFLKCYNDDYSLFIIGDGDQELNLKERAINQGVGSKIEFLGRLDHQTLVPILNKAISLLVNTESDLNMVSIVEAVAAGTPVLMTTVPLSASYISSNRLGIAKENWGASDLNEMLERRGEFHRNCTDKREELSTMKRVEEFLYVYDNYCAPSHFNDFRLEQGG
jgi:1,2-diacylglycerol 3-alpha-glucosyltransferase